MEYLEEKFGYLLEKNEEKPPKKLQQKQSKILTPAKKISDQHQSNNLASASVQSNIQEFYNKNYQFREMISLNV
jgi:hypothetical protein